MPEQAPTASLPDIDPRDPELIDRCAYALVEEQERCNGSKAAKYNAFRALKKAGVDRDLYAAVARSEIFSERLKLFTDIYLVRPREVQVVSALQDKAEAGDVAAAKELRLWSENALLTRFGELKRQIEAGGDEAALQAIEDLMERLETLKRNLQQVRPDEGMIRSMQERFRPATARAVKGGEVDDMGCYYPGADNGSES